MKTKAHTKTKARTPDEQRFWDEAFHDYNRDALRRNGKRSDHGRITWAAAMADGALAERQRSARGDQR